MSVLVTGDLHLSNNPRDDYRHTFMENTLPDIIKKSISIERLIILGDLCDQKDHHGAELVNRVVRQISDLSKYLAEIIILKGNHDYILEDSPFFEFLNKLPKVRWIGKPLRLAVPELGLCLFLPHTRDYKKAWAKEDLFDDLDWIFAHQTFEGTDIGARKLEGIPLGIFPDKTNIISGDIHIPQIINNTGLVRVQYVGAPYHINFGDDYRPQILSIEKGYLPKPIRVPGPQKRLVEIDDTFELSKLTKFNKGDMIKVRVNVDQDQFEHWAVSKKVITEWGEKNGYVISLIQPILNAQVKARKASDFRRKSDNDQLKDYAKRKVVSSATLETGYKLMEES